jgi:4-amino-4-deoxy-L-arabinose transferase-like glycosyltransferase
MARPKVGNAKSRGVTEKLPAKPPAADAPSRTHTQFLTLVLLYLFAAGLHVAALWEAARFPHLSTDEAQYTMVGENLRLGKGYTIRGQIHSGMPPIYPLFVAAAHSLGGPSRHSVLCFNCFAIGLVVFPVFLIARQFRLSPLNSYLMATAAAFLPHTFYAAMYMAESLQYPLVLTAFYITAKWLDQPFFRRDVWLGILLGAGLLNKFAELSFLIALLLTLLILSRRSRQRDQPRRAGHALIVFGIVVALELAWIAWKRVNGAGALGGYGTALEESMHAMAPLKLLLAYLGDFFLAAGLIVAVPLFYWFHENWGKQRSLSVLLATTLFCQLGIHGFFEARLTAMIRERLFLYSFPLMAIAAVAGMERFKQQSNIWVRYVAPYATVVFVALISLYNYPLPSPAVEAPWAGLLGSINRSGVVDFNYSRFLLDALWAVLIATTLLLILPRPRLATGSATVLAAFVVLFHVTTFLFTARLLAAWSRGGVGALQPVVNWLASSGVKPGDPLFIAGYWAFDARSAVAPTDEFFQSWIYKQGPYATLSVQLEALARYDVRMISGLAQIPSRMKPGDGLMIDTRVSDMDFVSEFYPYYLYRQPLQPSGPPRALYTIDLPPGVFHTFAGTVRGDGAIVGTGKGDTGVLAITNAIAFVPGRYRLTPHLKTKSGEQVVLSVNVHQTNRVLAHFEAPALDPLEFDIASEDLLNFSVYGKSTPDFLFEGVTVQFVSGPRPIPVRVLSQPTQQFAKVPSNLPVTPMSLSLVCSVENINNEGFAPAHRVRKVDGLHLFGWAFDSRTHFAEGHLLVELVSDNNHAYYAMAERTPRPDVVSKFQTPELAHSGFRLHASLQTIPAGWYRVYLIQMENGYPVECSAYRNVIVEEDRSPAQ